MLRLGWLSTGRGEGSRGFLKYVQHMITSGELDARIEFVFSNREPGEAEGSDQFFDLVHSYDIPLVTLSSQRWRREHGGGSFSAHRVEFHDEVMSLIEGFRVDLTVFLGYMLFTHTRFVEVYPSINPHPAAPDGPGGTWESVIWELIETRADHSGVRVHVATEDWDAGPLIAYCTFPIVGGPFDALWSDVEGRSIDDLRSEGEQQSLFRLIRKTGLPRERPVLAATLKVLASGEVVVRDGQALNRSGRPFEPRDVTDEVEQLVARGA